MKARRGDWVEVHEVLLANLKVVLPCAVLRGVWLELRDVLRGRAVAEVQLVLLNAVLAP